MSTGTIVRKILNMPEPTPNEAEPSEEAAEAPETREETKKRATTPGHGWSVEEEHPASRYGRIAGRVLIYALVAILALVGLRTLVSDPETPTTTSDPAEDFPTSEAEGVAARFTTNYLTSSADDEAVQDERARGLSLDVAGGSNVATEWEGEGTTRVRMAYPAGITHEEDGATAYVTVVAQVEAEQEDEEPAADAEKPTPSSASKDTKAKGAASSVATPAEENEPSSSTRWLALSVPVQVVGDRPVVAGTPAFVSLPNPGRASSPPATGDTDEAVTTRTEAGATAFFKAYAGSDGAALEQATAPGASLRPLGGNIKFSALREWRVEAGGDKRRTGHATVTWQVGESTVEQNYRVTLASISSGGTTSWRVSSVTAELSE